MTIDFRHVDTWVFDLDNTLYPPHIRLFDQIEKRMVHFVMGFLGVSQSEANRLRSLYWKEHGTTLAGLMDRHNMPPEQFLEDVHDIDFSVLPPAPKLADLVKKLPGRKIIYTNGTAPYARNVLDARGLLPVFDDIYGVEHAHYRPKPERAAFDQVFATANVTGPKAAMFEDEPRNLAVPHAMGLRTVHIGPDQETAPHIDASHPVLEDVLSQLHENTFILDPSRLPGDHD